MLSCQIKNILIWTDARYLDVEILVQGETLISERYYVQNGQVTLYEIRSLFEQHMRSKMLSFVDKVDFQVKSDVGEIAQSKFALIYCDRNFIIYDVELFLRSRFLTIADSRRVAPDSGIYVAFFAFADERINYVVRCDYYKEGKFFECEFEGPLGDMVAESDGVWQHAFEIERIAERAREEAGTEIELVAFTIRMGERVESYFIDKSLKDAKAFYFRNCFNVSDTILVPSVTTAKTKVDRSTAVLGNELEFYDANFEQTFEMETSGLTAEECALAEQMFCSNDVRTPFESEAFDDDIDALRPVLITECTCEISDSPHEPNRVKFTWRYAENRITAGNPLHHSIFNESYNYPFK